MITNKLIAIDTNVLIYCHSNDDFEKQKIAINLLDSFPIVSSQVISEYINVIKRKFPASKKEVLNVCTGNLELCKLSAVGMATLHLAKKLLDRYDFQLFDSIVVASALEVGCEILYSEDLHHGLVIEKKLKVINPFLPL
jgi:predicted nucleic acid-binding protein